MPVNDAADKTSGSPPIIVGQVLWPDKSAAYAALAVRDPSMPVWQDPWRDRTVMRRGIMVRQVGGTLPDWAEPTTESEPACILDLVLLHEKTSVAVREGWRVPETACVFRILIGEDQPLASDAVWHRLARADIAVSAAVHDFHAVARCFLDTMSGGRGDSLVGVDARDVLDVAGYRGSRVPRGRAIVILGQGVAAGFLVHDALNAIAREAEIGGVLLCQSVSPADATPHVVVELDAMATAAVGSGEVPTMLAGVLDRPRTEVVVIAFER